MDAEEFGRAVADEHLRLVRIVFMICGDRELAEDWAQEALIRAWEQLDGGATIGSLPGWTTTVALNRCRDLICRRGAESRALARAGVPEAPATVEPALSSDVTHAVLEPTPRASPSVRSRTPCSTPAGHSRTAWVLQTAPRTRPHRKTTGVPMTDLDQMLAGLAWTGQDLVAVSRSSRAAAWNPWTNAWISLRPPTTAPALAAVGVSGMSPPGGIGVALVWTGERLLDLTHGSVLNPQDGMWSDLALPTDIVRFTGLLQSTPVWDGSEVVAASFSSGPGLA